jgi:branched-chain amino acid transport system substrate-binding protein
MIVSKISYEVTDPTIDSQMVSLKASGADTFFNITTPKFAAQAIKKAAEIGWKPTHYLNSVSASVGSVMIPAGAGERRGRDHRQLPEGPDRPAVPDGQGLGRLAGLHEEVHPVGEIKDVNQPTATPWRRAWCRC